MVAVVYSSCYCPSSLYIDIIENEGELGYSICLVKTQRTHTVGYYCDVALVPLMTLVPLLP